MAQEDEVVKSGSKKRLSSTSADEDEPANKKRPGAASTEAGAEAVSSPVSSSADKAWSVEDCRGDHESVEHWELRKTFLVENQDRFPNRHRLICLSQVFANMEFLGCRYPEATMELVHELSLGIVEKYREKQKSRLQRTFVKASDAAERKTKGAKASPSVSSAHDRSSFSSAINKSSFASHFTAPQLLSSTTTTDSTSSNKTTTYNAIDPIPSVAEDEDDDDHVDIKIGHPIFTVDDRWDPMYEDIQRMILLVYPYDSGESPISIVHRSCSAAKVPIVTEFQGSFENYICTYRIGKNLVVESLDSHSSKDAAKAEAAKFAFEKLQKWCYTFVTKVRVSPNFDGKEIVKDEVDGHVAPDLKFNGAGGPSDDNIGTKLLKLMGWSGGGLGKNEQGIHEAISVDGVVGRSRLGLGNDSKRTFHGKIKELLEKHKRAGFPHDLKFASDFSKDERKEIHMIAQRLGLKSKSYGKDDDRFIVVSEKISRQNLIKSTLAKGGETDRYKVIPPGGSLEGVLDLSN